MGAAPAAASNAFIHAFATGGGALIGDRATNYFQDKAKSLAPSSGGRSLAAAAAPKGAAPAFGGANYWGGAVSASLEKGRATYSSLSSSSLTASGPSFGAHSLSAAKKSYSGNPAGAAAFGGRGIEIGFVGGAFTGRLAAVSSLAPLGLDLSNRACC